jgi:AbrB family looped-hinge helix DNA binding protein
MHSTKLSSKGQVIIPKALRDTHHWASGLELTVTDTGDGLLLKAKAPFPAVPLSEVAGMLKTRVEPKSEAQIAAALTQDLRRRWRGGN